MKRRLLKLALIVLSVVFVPYIVGVMAPASTVVVNNTTPEFWVYGTAAIIAFGGCFVIGAMCLYIILGCLFISVMGAVMAGTRLVNWIKYGNN